MSLRVSEIESIKVPAVFEEEPSGKRTTQPIIFTPEQDAAIVLHRDRIGPGKFHKLFNESYQKVSDVSLLKRAQQLADLGIKTIEDVERLHQNPGADKISYKGEG